MNFKTILKIVSCILIMSTLLTFFGCDINYIFSTDSALGLLSEELDDEKTPDNVEEDINNNKGKIIFSSPRKSKVSVYENYLHFSGICNSDYPLSINGKEQNIGDYQRFLDHIASRLDGIWI